MHTGVLDVQHLAAFLTPLLPYLTGTDETVRQEAIRKLGLDMWNQGKSIWDRLRPEIESRAVALEALRDVTQMPQDADALAAFRLQLKKLLAENQLLSNEVLTLLQGTQPESAQPTPNGSRNVVAQGTVNSSFIVTGDRNILSASRH